MKRKHRSPGRPLSMWIYLWRNKKVLPLLVVLAMAVFGITVLVTLLDSLAASRNIYYGNLKQISIVNSSDPGVIAQIRTNDYVRAVYPGRGVAIQVPMVLAGTILDLFGVSEESVDELSKLYNTRVIAGRLPNPKAAEFVVSEEVAKARGFKLGDIIGPSADNQDALPADLTLVGILKSDETIGFVPLDYLERDARFSGENITRFLIVPKEGKKEAMDEFLVQVIASQDATVTTYEDMASETRQTMTMFYLVLGVIDALIVAILSITTGMLNYIFLTQRLGEFALFHAIGHSKGRLAQRVLGELGILTFTAWLGGELLAMGTLLWIGTSVFAQRGQDFYVFDPRGVIFTAPIPIIVVVMGISVVVILLSRLDPVSIIERRT